MKITFNQINEQISNILNTSLGNDLTSFMNYYSMANSDIVNNRNLIAYLSNLMNFIARHGNHTYSLNVQFDGKIKEGLNDFFCRFIEEHTEDDGKVHIPNWNFATYTQTALSNLIANEGMLGIAAGDKFICSELCTTIQYTTSLAWNLAATNGINALWVDTNSTLSNDFVKKDVLQTLMENIVFSRINDSKVTIYTSGLSQLSAMCSSSSSSSSSAFIAYMKLD